jgi:hypothetical protein
LVFLGREIGEQRDYSESVAEEIDGEVRRIISEAYEHARRVLNENQDKLELIAQTLLEVETLGREEFVRLMDGVGEEEPQASGKATPPKAKPGKKVAESGEEDSASTLDLPPAPAPA